MAEKSRKLYRSSSNKMIGGICGGIAEYLDIDPTIIRVAYLLLSIFTACFPGLIVYIILLFVIPKESDYFDI